MVVDTRNIHGHSIKLLGEPRHVTVEGVKNMFSSLGFDVQDIFMGTATKVVGGAPSAALMKTSQINIQRAEKWRGEGATILEGILAERRGVIEEKQVDVLCALKVVELAVVRGNSPNPHTIFILTEDMDLDPAANLATEWRAKVIRVAPGNIHQRSDNKSGWMLITRKDFYTLCAFPGTPESATKLRRSLVRTITDCVEPRRYSFLRYEGQPDEDQPKYAVLRSNQGLHVKMENPEPGLKYKDKISLRVQDVRMNDRSQGFPDIYVGESPDNGYLHNIVSAKILYWSGQDRIYVQIDRGGNQYHIPVPVGEALAPNDEIILLLRSSNKVGDRSYIYLGPSVDLSDDAAEETHLQFGTVTKIEGNLGFVKVGSGDEWVMKISSSLEDKILIGSQIRVANTGYIHLNTERPLCFPLSSAL